MQELGMIAESPPLRASKFEDGLTETQLYNMIEEIFPALEDI